MWCAFKNYLTKPHTVLFLIVMLFFCGHVTYTARVHGFSVYHLYKLGNYSQATLMCMHPKLVTWTTIIQSIPTACSIRYKTPWDQLYVCITRPRLHLTFKQDQVYVHSATNTFMLTMSFWMPSGDPQAAGCWSFLEANTIHSLQSFQLHSCYLFGMLTLFPSTLFFRGL